MISRIGTWKWKDHFIFNINPQSEDKDVEGEQRKVGSMVRFLVETNVAMSTKIDWKGKERKKDFSLQFH